MKQSCLLALLWIVSCCTKVFGDPRGERKSLHKCCAENELLVHNKTHLCTPWVDFNVTSWGRGDNLVSKHHLDLIPGTRPHCYFPLEEYHGEFDVDDYGELVIHNLTYDPPRFCIDLLAQDNGEPKDVVLFCIWKPFVTTEAVNDTHALYHCCGPGQSYSIKSFCVPHPVPFEPKFYDSQSGKPIRSNISYSLTEVNDGFCTGGTKIIIDDVDFYVIQNAHLYIPYKNLSYPPGEFCLEQGLKEDGNTVHRLIALICQRKKKKIWKHKELCSQRVCVQKCCPETKAVYKGVKCQEHPQPFTLEFRNYMGYTVNPPDEFNVTSQGPVCPPGSNALEFTPSQDDIHLLVNGDVYSVKMNRYYSPPQYCIDDFFNETSVTRSGFFCSGVPMREGNKYTTFMLPLLTLSCILLFLTLLVYGLIPDLRNLHGKTLMAHVASLLLAFTVLLISYLGPKNKSRAACKAQALTSYFAFLSSFCWLNVMSFDICSMMTQSGKSRDNPRRFIKYCAYAWGCPLILTIIIAVIDNVSRLPPYVIAPNIGVKTCWINSDVAILVYFHCPLTILLICNSVFFGITAFHLCKANKETTMVQDQKRNRQRLFLYLKLFVVMGVVWFAEVISWHVGPDELWIVTDAVNALQGLFVFIIFVCKKKILLKVRKALKPSYVSCRKLCNKEYESTCSTRRSSTNVTSTTDWRTGTEASHPGSKRLAIISEPDATQP